MTEKTESQQNKVVRLVEDLTSENSVKLGRQPVAMAKPASAPETKGRQPVGMAPMPGNAPANTPQPSAPSGAPQPFQNPPKD